MLVCHFEQFYSLQNRPHQKTITYPHAAPPKMAKKYTELLGGGEGVITLPLPCGEHEKIPVKETLLFNWIKMYHSAKKRNKQL